MENFSNIPIKKPSVRNFSFVFFIVFIICSIFFFEKPYLVSASFFLLGLLILISGFYFPKILEIPNRLWFKFGIFLGHIISPIIMGIIYFFILFPTSLFVKLLKYDVINKRISKSSDTYWIKRSTPVQPFKDQF